MAEQQFERADFEALMGMDVDELVDGQELSCGFVRISAVGLYSDYKPKRGDELLFDMNFNRGKPVLPFPSFTLEEFKAFYAWHLLFRLEVIEGQFTMPDGTTNVPALAELDARSYLAGILVRSVLGIPHVPVVAASASGGVEPDAGQLAASQPQAATPSPAPAVQAKAKRRSWWDVASPYMVKIMQDGQYATAKEFYNALDAKAGSNSPFDRGTGNNRYSLFIREIAAPLKIKTVQNNWQKLLNAAAQK